MSTARMKKRGPACGRPSRLTFGASALRSELADEGGPVAERCPCAGAMVGAAAGAEQVVAGAAREERAAPVGVVAGTGAGHLAGEPDRVAVDRGRPVVTPAGAWRIADLRLVARE